MESRGIAEGQAPVVQEPYLPSLQRGFEVRYREDEDARVGWSQERMLPHFPGFGEGRTDMACQFSQREPPAGSYLSPPSDKALSQWT